jgi:hypothetical protein
MLICEGWSYKEEPVNSFKVLVWQKPINKL